MSVGLCVWLAFSACSRDETATDAGASSAGTAGAGAQTSGGGGQAPIGGTGGTVQGGAGSGGGGGAGGSAGGEGGTAGLADPAVFRAYDDADVCGSSPPPDCTPADMAFVASEYGSEVVRADEPSRGEMVFRLVSFVERVGPSNIDVLVVDESGAPLVGVPVAFYYPSAPEPSRPDEWYSVKVTTDTEADGIAGFALGGGAYLPCCGCGGPHAIWISLPGSAPETTEPSDLADALGMLGGTNHRHLDVQFQRVMPPPAPAPVDATRCPLQ